MRLFKTVNGIVVEAENHYYLLKENWESFINDDNLYHKVLKALSSLTSGDSSLIREVLPPIGNQQELWACGVTYLRSKIGREEESKVAGGADFYGKVYEAVRPECFFKSNPHRIVGNKSPVRIRKDSTWNVPEPELTLVVTSSGKIIGYTAGNDMSSRSIEGENPLYLPQAKTYDGCASLGPAVFISDRPFDRSSKIYLQIIRAKQVVFEESISVNQMKRSLEELVKYVYLECSFPHGCLIMTGTGIVPPGTFTLQPGDEIIITIDSIGKLINTVA
ncbi:MAG TPA: fumarylacetoacetate hydrolase family protein [Bacteroidales bacterium]|nr:fumarylacetoacetate hydrolase family protein [Bacteroidales bacterium]